MRQSLGCVACPQAMEDLGGIAALVRAHRRRVPLIAVRVILGDEGRLTAHRQAHVRGAQRRIDRMATGLDRRPLCVRVGPGVPRGFPDTPHAHVVFEDGFALVHGAGDRCRRTRLRRTGERNMTFPGQQPGGRIEPDPACARQVDLAPGVQVGEILRRTCGSVERLYVRHQLDQVSGDEARCEPQVAQQVNQQCRRVTAGAGALLQRLLRQLHPGLQPDQVADLAGQPLVDLDQEVDRAARLARDAGEECGNERRCRRLDQVRDQLAPLGRRVGEGKLFG